MIDQWTPCAREREGKEEGVRSQKKKKKKNKKVKAAVGRNRTPVSSELLFFRAPGGVAYTTTKCSTVELLPPLNTGVQARSPRLEGSPLPC